MGKSWAVRQTIGVGPLGWCLSEWRSAIVLLRGGEGMLVRVALALPLLEERGIEEGAGEEEDSSVCPSGQELDLGLEVVKLLACLRA